MAVAPIEGHDPMSPAQDIDTTFSNTDLIKSQAVLTMSMVAALDASGLMSKLHFASILRSEVEGFEQENWARIMLILAGILDQKDHGAHPTRSQWRVVEGGAA